MNRQGFFLMFVMGFYSIQLRTESVFVNQVLGRRDGIRLPNYLYFLWRILSNPITVNIFSYFISFDLNNSIKYSPGSLG